MFLGLPEFDVVAARTLSEACALLARHGAEAKVLAGGTDLLVKMKHKRVLPRYLINIKPIAGLDQIRSGADGLQIGALTKIQALKQSPAVARHLPILQQAASKLGTTQIRNLGTLGGNLGNASPSADCGVALLILGAVAHCVGCEGERDIAIEDFFVGPGMTALKPDEIVTGIHVPHLPPRAEGIYLKHSLRAMDVAIAGAAILVVMEERMCREVRIGLGAVAPTPIRARKAEALLRGQKLPVEAAQRELLEQAGRLAAEEALPITDIRARAAYRRQIVGKLVSQGLQQVIARAGLGQGRKRA